MPASANTAPTIYHLQENKNITEYRLDKTPFDSQSPYPTDSSTLHSSGSLSLPSIMKDNCLPNQSSVSSRFSTDSSILPSPISSHGNITSDFSKLDTLAAAAGSILVSLANFGQPTSTTTLASAKPEDSGSNESSKKDIIQCSDNLADLAAAAISSLSDLAATGREVPLSKQVEKLASRTPVATSNEHKKGGFMSISALLDEGPPRSNENPSSAYTPSFGQLQSYDSSKHTVKQLLDDVNIIAGDREKQSTKRLLSEPELPFKKRYAPSRFDSPVNSRSNSVSYHHDGNEVFNGNSAGGYMNTVAVDQNTSLPQPDSSYSRSSRYNGSYQPSGASSTQSAPIPRYKPAAHGSAPNFPNNTASTGHRNPQPSYQPLRVEGPNTFSKKYQSMQDPKVKRNATHAYIAYMIYTDRLQNKGSEVKGESMPIHRPMDPAPSLNHYGHSVHTHSHNRSYSHPHNHDHPPHPHSSHQHAHPTHSHPPQHNHLTHQHYPHQHQRPHAHQHPHTHQHQHPYHHHHPHEQHSQTPQTIPQPPYSSNVHTESRYSQSSPTSRSNSGRYEPQENSPSQYYPSYERSANGPSPMHSSGPAVSSRPTSTAATISGYLPDSNYGALHRRDSSNSNTYGSGPYSSAPLIPPSAYSPSVHSSPGPGSYGIQTSTISSRGPTDSRYYESERVPSKASRFI